MIIGNVSLSPQARHLILAWLVLALAALVLAGVFAFLAAMTRTPLVTLLPRPGYFHTALVAHVTFSLTVWLLSFIAILWVLLLAWEGASWNLKLGWLGVGLAGGGVLVMTLGVLSGRGEAVLVDYLPFLKSLVFIGGLVAFLAGIGVAAINFLWSLARHARPITLATSALRYAALVYLLAGVAFLLAWIGGQSRDYADLLWGPGHLLQVVNAAAMVAVWMWLGRLFLSRHRFLHVLFPLFLLPGLVIPLLYVFPSSFQQGATGTVTWLGLGIPTVAAGGVVMATLFRRGSALRQGEPGVAVFLLSLLLFGVGVVIAAMGLESDTRVPAHYHAAIGSVTIAFMGMTYKLLPALGLSIRMKRFARLQPYLYGSGLLLLILGLYWAGSLNAPRKAFETLTGEPALLAAMNLMGLGALVAVAGGAAFVWVVGLSLSRRSARLPTKEDGIPLG